MHEPNTRGAHEHREQARQRFLEKSGHAGATLVGLAQDASFRRYFRLCGSKRPLLLMDAPAPFEDTRPYILIDEHLRSLDLLAPEIVARDVDEGFLLLEDFGNDTFTHLLAQGRDACPLYELAVNVLVRLNDSPRAKDVAAPAYDTHRLLEETALLPDWYYPLVRDEAVNLEARDAYLRIWRRALDDMPPPHTTLVLRDFHVDNLMLVQRHGAGLCGLLDFQDAVIGPSAYDLASLLQDARRDIAPEFESRFIEYFLERTPSMERSGFLAWYALLAAQRHAKVLGIFSRLCLRDGKCHYLKHLPRVARLLEDGLSRTQLAPLADWLNQWLPGRHDYLTRHFPENPA
jgi:N-acetylmuramate 1-kinase